MKRFLAGFFTGAVIVCFVIFAYLVLGMADVRSDAPTPGWLARLFYVGIHASVRRNCPKIDSPAPRDADTLIAGGKIYLNDCVGCHGELGRPPSDFGATFNPPAPQFPQKDTEYSEAEVFCIAKHGIRRTGMGAQSSSYADQQLWTLAAFIVQMRHLPPMVLKGIQQGPKN